MSNSINTNGLLFKGAFNTQDLLTPVFLYRSASNAYITLADIYIAADPSLDVNVTLYITKQIMAPNADDAILENSSLSNYNGTIVLNNIELTFSESIFIATSSVPGNITVQIRGRTQIIPPVLLMAESN